MIIYEVLISQSLVEKLSDIAKYIDSINTYPSGENYINELIDDIMTLSYRAESIPRLQWRTKAKFHPQEKRLLVKKGKFAVFFHTYYNYVIVDDIVPSSMMSEKV